MIDVAPEKYRASAFPVGHPKSENALIELCGTVHVGCKEGDMTQLQWARPLRHGLVIQERALREQIDHMARSVGKCERFVNAGGQ
jgi:hypothetical protein